MQNYGKCRSVFFFFFFLIRLQGIMLYISYRNTCGIFVFTFLTFLKKMLLTESFGVLNVLRDNLFLYPTRLVLRVS